MAKRGVSLNMEGSAMNPYHYILHCLSGKWKMTILHEMQTFGSIRFNQTIKVLPISEKVFIEQMREMIRDGLVTRICYDTMPPKVEYKLTKAGEQLIPAMDFLYIWSVSRMDELGIPIDQDAFTVHQDKKYMKDLKLIMESKGFRMDGEYKRKPKK